MSIYDAVLVDLRAKRDAMSELILALESVARLGPSPAALAAAVTTAESDVRPSVRPTKPVPARAKGTTPRRATDVDTSRSEDAGVIQMVTRATTGVSAGALSEAFPAGTNRVTVRRVLARLVAEGRLVQRGARAGTRYWPAGTPAKEAVQRP